jgi:hypothetical protein
LPTLTLAGATQAPRTDETNRRRLSKGRLAAATCNGQRSSSSLSGSRRSRSGSVPWHGRAASTPGTPCSGRRARSSPMIRSTEKRFSLTLARSTPNQAGQRSAEPEVGVQPEQQTVRNLPVPEVLQARLPAALSVIATGCGQPRRVRPHPSMRPHGHPAR